MSIVDDWRPETAAGGFARDDEAFTFYARVNALVRPDMVVVDLGAGRGARFDDETAPFMRDLCSLRGRVKRLIGLDVDDVVLTHPGLDESHVIEPGGSYPLADESVDMVVGEWVIEHIEHPDTFAAEIARILRPGGWFCALTPNLHGYVGIGNTIVPERIKDALTRKVWPERHDYDAFPTFYRLNTQRAMQKAFDPSEWSHFGYTDNGTPKYHGNRSFGFAAVGFLQALAPPAMRTNLLVFCRKR